MKESFTEVQPFADEAAAYFYGRLFAENPRLRSLFPPAMAVQHDRLIQALTRIVWSLDSPDALAAYLSRLGHDHRKFGVAPEDYDAVGKALIATLRKFSSKAAWTPEVESAWKAAYASTAGIMTKAAEEDTAPPWWIAEVVEHERRTPDIAVLTVRPGQRLRYAAGQYVTVQVSRWPRVWRPLSVANAPRQDGAMTFHVRALPAGWVSGSLVRDTRVGDALLIGPPRGTMTLDPESDRDLLLVAGGTGLASLKALAQQAVTSGQGRGVHLLFGARTTADLYDLPDLRLLEAAHPELRVIPVVSQDSSFDGMRGLVADVLDRFDGWDEHDCYIAGPDAMINYTVGCLQRLGVPPVRIHHDVPSCPAPPAGPAAKARGSRRSLLADP